MSAGRWSRHKQLNAIIRSASHTAGYPSTLEPVGLSLVDGKRPDGLSLVPEERGKCLLWDATWSCTLAVSNIRLSSIQASFASSSAERLKMETYKEFLQNHCFIPLGFETVGGDLLPQIWLRPSEEWSLNVLARLDPLSFWNRGCLLLFKEETPVPF